MRRAGLREPEPPAPASGFNRETTADDLRARLAWEQWAERQARKRRDLASATAHSLAGAVCGHLLDKLEAGPESQRATLVPGGGA